MCSPALPLSYQLMSKVTVATGTASLTAEMEPLCQGCRSTLPILDPPLPDCSMREKLICNLINSRYLYCNSLACTRTNTSQQRNHIKPSLLCRPTTSAIQCRKNHLSAMISSHSPKMLAPLHLLLALPLHLQSRADHHSGSPSIGQEMEPLGALDFFFLKYR